MTAMTSQAVRIDQHGAAEELKLVEVQVGEPGPGEIRIRHKAIGLNFIDVYQRSGLYPLPMPLQLGSPRAKARRKWPATCLRWLSAAR